MTTHPTSKLAEPRFVQQQPMIVAGLGSHFTFEGLGGLPALWQRAAPLLEQIPGQRSASAGRVAYGLCYNTDGSGFDYIAGVEVAPGTRLPPEFTSCPVGAQRYAVFWHAEHVSTVRGTFMAIFNEWLPLSGCAAADAPVFERYDERFDRRTGMGGFEVWIPLAA